MSTSEKSRSIKKHGDDKLPIKQQSDGQTDPSTSSPPLLEPLNMAKSTNGSVLLFGQTTSTLPAPPKLMSLDKLGEWKRMFIDFLVMNNSNVFVELSAIESWKLAVELTPAHLKSSMMLQYIYVQQNRRIVSAISTAVIKVIPNLDSIIEEVKREAENGSTPAPLSHLPPEFDAYRVWSKLINNYEKKTIFGIHHLYNQIQGLKYIDGEDPTVYLNQFQSLNSKLCHMLSDKTVPLKGQVFSESHKAILLLNGLPKSMGTDKTILMSKETLTVDELRSTLMRRFEAKGAKASSDTATEQANTFVSHRGRGGNRGGYRGTRGARGGRGGRGGYNNQHNKQQHEQSESAEPPSHYNFMLYDVPTHPDDQSEEEIDSDDESEAEDQALALSGRTVVGDSVSERVILDSGCTRHTWIDQRVVKDKKSVSMMRMATATGKLINITTLGTVDLHPRISIAGVAVVPSATANLLSVSRLTEAGCSIMFSRDKAELFSPSPHKEHILTFKREDNLYVYHRRLVSDRIKAEEAKEGCIIHRKELSGHNQKSNDDSASTSDSSK